MSKEVLASVPIFASAARTATPTPFTANDGGHPRVGGQFTINVTAIGAAPSVVFNIEGLDPVSGVYYPILTSAAITATGTTVLRVYPGAANTANLSVSDYIPPQWRVRPVHGNSDSITYSMTANMR